MHQAVKYTLKYKIFFSKKSNEVRELNKRFLELEYLTNDLNKYGVVKLTSVILLSHQEKVAAFYEKKLQIFYS